ncbi:GDSL family lipase [Ramlibacter sp. G-1-2-2]|uniref:GDSL family lipase n=1 Tax=Ramlibacter agri TaxID=2728837 RepID=A0A848GZP5_9BURK|nr:SGNH/GDSL hydrolase family protein [Ramlibacter agri]NML42769.1 GDSL family lipase [Ramlibacter agri]
MATKLLRRALLLVAAASALVLAACGGGTVDSKFTPDRIVVFGDAVADLGQNGARYTVNDGSVNNWTTVIANNYGRALAASVNGGLSYAIGNARVTQTPDAAGNAATPTVAQQVSTFLASHGSGSTDLVIFNGGTSDVIVQTKAVLDGTITQAQAMANLDQAGHDLSDQVRRVLAAGATHVVVVGPYNMGRSVWAQIATSTSLMEQLSLQFNNRLLVNMVDLGDRVLYVDAAFYFNLVTSSPSSYSFNNVSGAVCNSVDAGPGIGTGLGRINSNLCTTSTLIATDYNHYVFADLVYMTPQSQSLFGDYALSRIHDRW